eukprot:s3561_g5.t1
MLRFTYKFSKFQTPPKKGFDADLIRQPAEKETHPILGDTFRLDVHNVSDEVLHATAERRLTELENEGLQRRAQGAAAEGLPELDLLQAAEPEKDLQSVAKDGNAALRSLQNFVRGQKENSNPNTGKGRGKGNGKKSE